MTLRDRVRQGVINITHSGKSGVNCFEFQEWLDDFLKGDVEAAMLPQPEFMIILEEVMKEQDMVLDQGLIHYTVPDNVIKFKT